MSVIFIIIDPIFSPLHSPFLYVWSNSVIKNVGKGKGTGNITEKWIFFFFWALSLKWKRLTDEEYRHEVGSRRESDTRNIVNTTAQPGRGD